jgi:signal transduction histidine kinase
MARPPETPDWIETDPDGAGFEDERTPILATGTRDDLAEKAARVARDAELDDDVAALAHDLKNPLTIIMLEASQIEERLGTRIPPAVQRGLERIGQNAAYIDRLVSDLLDLTSHEAGKLELRLETVDLPRLLRAAVDRSVPTIDRMRVSIEIRTSAYVNGDETRIARVVSNLVTNALKYCEGQVVIRLDARGEHACVSVIDTGPGLSDDESRRVFERYRRASTAQSGYGLGLHTSRRIIEAHHGRIGIASQPGRGSRFFFELPLVKGPEGSQREK